MSDRLPHAHGFFRAHQRAGGDLSEGIWRATGLLASLRRRLWRHHFDLHTPGVLVLCIMCLLAHTALIGLFAKGFLLNRTEIPLASHPADWKQLVAAANLSHLLPSSSTPDRVSERPHSALPLHPTAPAPALGWTSPAFSRLVFLIVDALRFDFARPCEAVQSSPPQPPAAGAANGSHAHSLPLWPPCERLPYVGHLPVFKTLLETHPAQTRLFRFKADPPTTTLQRLKALTTGSLPTFVEVGANFASGEIKEDNWIDQLHRQLQSRPSAASASDSRKMVFLGDDTWTGLFPNSFDLYHPYPSFNVHDLHTVDRGVVSQLFPLMGLPSPSASGANEPAGPAYQRLDWHTVVGHFLGVDHVGHRFGPFHPAMPDKLDEINAIVDAVVQQMVSDPDKFSDTLLVVCGDHGMTREGDHGGDTADEMDATLFAFSTTPFFFEHTRSSDDGGDGKDFRSVSQIDLVPTLSLLFGLPIPFGNLGTVIPEFLPRRSGAATQHSLDELNWWLLLTSLQVERYLSAYANVSDDMDGAEVAQLASALQDAHASVWARRTAFPDSLDSHPYVAYLHSVQALCRRTWAKFNTVYIALGIGGLVSAALVAVALSHLGSNSVVLDTAAWALFLCTSFASTSNSFVINENRTYPFLLVTLLLGVLWLFARSSITAREREQKRAEQPMRHTSVRGVASRIQPNTMLTAVQHPSALLSCFVILLAAVRLTKLFSVCREEQVACLLSNAMSTLSTNVAPLWVWLCLYAAAFLVLWLALFSRRLLDTAPISERQARFLNACSWVALFALLLFLYTSVDDVAIGSSASWWHSVAVWSARAVYAACTLALLVAYASAARPALAFHAIFLLSTLGAALAGDRFAPSILLLALGCIAWLELQAVFRPIPAPELWHSATAADHASPHFVAHGAASPQHVQKTVSGSLSWPVLVCAWLLGWCVFFHTGHQKTFPAIRWTAAFAGFDEMQLIRSGGLVLLDTFLGPILGALTMALHCARVPPGSQRRKQYALYVLRVFAIQSAHLVCVMGAAFLHRRHLMAWKIFAPNFMFSSVAALVVDVVHILLVPWVCSQAQFASRFASR